MSPLFPRQSVLSCEAIKGKYTGPDCSFLCLWLNPPGLPSWGLSDGRAQTQAHVHVHGLNCQWWGVGGGQVERGWGGARSQTCTHHLSLERGSRGEAAFMTSAADAQTGRKSMNSYKMKAFLCSTSVSGCCFGPQLLRYYATWHLTPRMPTWAFDWCLVFCQIKSKFHCFPPFSKNWSFPIL